MLITLGGKKRRLLLNKKAFKEFMGNEAFICEKYTDNGTIVSSANGHVIKGALWAAVHRTNIHSGNMNLYFPPEKNFTPPSTAAQLLLHICK